MSKIRVAVLRGGPSSEFDVSLNTGKTVLDNLPNEYYEPLDIFIDKNGSWHRGGFLKTPSKALHNVDVVFNALHGSYGEDGKVQTILDQLQIPYTGSGAIASAIGLNKILSKKAFNQSGIKTPLHKVLTIDDINEENLLNIFRSFPHPSITKPYNSGSSMGVSMVQSFDDLKNGIAHAFEYAPKVILEEYISGKEGTMGIIDNFRGKEHYMLMPVEIRPQESNFFNYDEKYSGKQNEICPGNFTKSEIEEIEKAALAAHKSINARHYSRTDFIIHPRRGVFIIEINTLPGLTKESLVPKSLQAVGIKLGDFLHHVVQLARGWKRE
jgi:D-alanine-D-alanine ligase